MTLTDKIYRILDAFQFMADGRIYPYNCSDEKMTQLDDDASEITEHYQLIKWKMGFGEAMRIAKADFMQKILESEVEYE